MCVSFSEKPVKSQNVGAIFALTDKSIAMVSGPTTSPKVSFHEYFRIGRVSFASLRVRACLSVCDCVCTVCL